MLEEEWEVDYDTSPGPVDQIIKAFMEALYPGYDELAMASVSDLEALQEATRQLNERRAGTPASPWIEEVRQLAESVVREHSAAANAKPGTPSGRALLAKSILASLPPAPKDTPKEET